MTWQTSHGPIDYVSTGCWECATCKVRSSDGRQHEEGCPSHPQARIIRLEKRVAALEAKLAQIVARNAL